MTAPALVLQATTGRLYPTPAQTRVMARIGGQCRAMWNHWLAVSRDRYEAEAKFAFYTEMSAALPMLRAEERFQGLPHRCAQMTVQKLDRALKDCAKAKTGRKGFPKFKRRDDRRDAFQFVGRELRVEPGRIKMPVLGWIRVRGLRVPEGARLVQVTIRQEPKGWGVALQFEGAAPVYAAPSEPVVGIDVGLESLLALSTGQKVSHPRLARRQAKRLRRLEREKARRRKGGVNRCRTVARLGREHAKLAARRRDFTHKATRTLIDAHAGVAVESLTLKGLMRTRLAKSFADAGIGEFIRQLRYKAEWAGREFRVMPRFQRSTGVCPACDRIGPKLPLSVRSWVCQGCGAEHDRDVAAAQVILRRAVGVGSPEPAAAMPRKRGFAVRGGGRAQVRPSYGGPPANVAEAHVTGVLL